jgi:hypothetical protein
MCTGPQIATLSLNVLAPNETSTTTDSQEVPVAVRNVPARRLEACAHLGDDRRAAMSLAATAEFPRALTRRGMQPSIVRQGSGGRSEPLRVSFLFGRPSPALWTMAGSGRQLPDLICHPPPTAPHMLTSSLHAGMTLDSWMQQWTGQHCRGASPESPCQPLILRRWDRGRCTAYARARSMVRCQAPKKPWHPEQDGTQRP